MGFFGPFDPMADQKTIQTSCLGGFSVMWVPKVLLIPIEIRILGPKRPNLVLCIYGHLGPNIGRFGPLGPMPDQKKCKKGA